MRKITFLFMIGLISLALNGCGYSSSSLLPSNFRTIHIQPFKNKIVYGTESNRSIYYTLLEVRVTNTVIDRYQFDGNLKVAKEDTADLVLKGELLGYERHPLRYFDDNEEVEEYRLNIIVSLQLWDMQKEELMWEEPSFAGETDYFVTGADAKSESDAVKEALTDLARRVVERTIEDW